MSNNIFRKIRNFIIKFFNALWLYDPNFQIANEKWRIHKVDNDKNFPSIPHMDCITNSRKKMNIYNGEIYLKCNRKCVDQATKKELKRLWDDIEFRTIVYNERTMYYKLYNKDVKESVPEIYQEEYEKYNKNKLNV